MSQEKVLVSVIIPTFNEEESIASCIESILEQDFENFELILVDDASSDNTEGIIKRYADPRIRYIPSSKNLGPAGARNIGLSYAQGEYIFFTDVDCIALPGWITQGLAHFQEKQCLGVMGLTLPDKSTVTASDRAVSSWGGKYLTCNIAYKKDSLIRVEGFDEYLRVGEDSDLGLNIEKLGNICFNKNMIVLHKVEKLNFKHTIMYAWYDGKGRVYIIKKHKINIKFIYPKQLLGLICPLFLLIYYAFQTLEDFKSLPVLYLRLVTLRLAIWVSAFRKGILLV